MINITPTEDWIEHIEDTTCICQPDIEIVDGEIMVKHNAIDEREKDETDKGELK